MSTLGIVASFFHSLTLLHVYLISPCYTFGHLVFLFLVSAQKANGTCNTNFKKTKCNEQVVQALEDFVDKSVPILVCMV